MIAQIRPICIPDSLNDRFAITEMKFQLESHWCCLLDQSDDAAEDHICLQFSS